MEEERERYSGAYRVKKSVVDLNARLTPLTNGQRNGTEERG